MHIIVILLNSSSSHPDSRSIIMMFCSLCNRHTFSLVAIKPDKNRLTSLIRINGALERHGFSFFISSFYYSFSEISVSLSLSLFLSFSLFDSRHFVYHSLCFVSIWCALPSRKLTVKKIATYRYTFISAHQRVSELLIREIMGSDASKSKKRTTQLTEEEIQLLLKNTHFNRQQIKEWHQGFLVSRLINE